MCAVIGRKQRCDTRMGGAAGGYCGPPPGLAVDAARDATIEWPPPLTTAISTVV